MKSEIDYTVFPFGDGDGIKSKEELKMKDMDSKAVLGVVAAVFKKAELYDKLIGIDPDEITDALSEIDCKFIAHKIDTIISINKELRAKKVVITEEGSKVPFIVEVARGTDQPALPYTDTVIVPKEEVKTETKVVTKSKSKVKKEKPVAPKKEKHDKREVGEVLYNLADEDVKPIALKYILGENKAIRRITNGLAPARYLIGAVNKLIDKTIADDTLTFTQKLAKLGIDRKLIAFIAEVNVDEVEEDGKLTVYKNTNLITSKHNMRDRDITIEFKDGLISRMAKVGLIPAFTQKMMRCSQVKYYNVLRKEKGNEQSK